MVALAQPMQAGAAPVRWLTPSEAGRISSDAGIDAQELMRAMCAGEVPACHITARGPEKASLKAVEDHGYGRSTASLMVSSNDLDAWVTARTQQRQQAEQNEAEHKRLTPTVNELASEIVGDDPTSGQRSTVTTAHRHHDLVCAKGREIFQAVANGQLDATGEARGAPTGRPITITTAMAWQLLGGSESVQAPGGAGKVSAQSVRVSREKAAALGFVLPVPTPPAGANPTPSIPSVRGRKVAYPADLVNQYLHLKRTKTARDASVKNANDEKLSEWFAAQHSCDGRSAKGWRDAARRLVKAQGAKAKAAGQKRAVGTVRN